MTIVSTVERLRLRQHDLSQSHAGLNLSQFQTDCLLRINLSIEMLNYLKLFESILGIATTLTNEIKKNIDTLRYLRPSQIGMLCIHYFFINDECITWQFKNLFN